MVAAFAAIDLRRVTGSIGRSAEAPVGAAVRPVAAADEVAIEHTSVSGVAPVASATQHSWVAAIPVGIRIIPAKLINS